MQEKNKLVGRGLKDLIEEHNIDKVLDGEVILEIKLNDIKANPFQPRKVFDEDRINELALSIKEHGVFQPIIVKKTNEGYIIVSGERRFRASKKVGLELIPAVVRNYSDTKIAEISLVENLQREDLTPIEEANAYKKIIDGLGITQLELSNKVGKSRSHITNIIGLLKLPQSVQDMLLEKKLTMGHARTLSKLKDEKKIIELANKIIKENLSVRDIEEISEDEVKKQVNEKKNSARKVFKEEKNLLKKYYGAKVSIKNNKIVFKIDDEEQLKSVLEQLIKNAISN
ncbi:ParB/RepB/Spo0J family partition protein [Haploplasma axanthum]|uniref:Nucleoid occlusion protein n=1 Tax=Haploplasma axanthum TaxID=29552 RepID=A0A449BBB7_HAPAX|nr:ParB/RepB/Spo0J family partition protein [Haploplasma axanthum]VEU79641.1 Nucleoid occlusion protein [Haploplasma axanthum]